jgi:cytochrome oxidase Cu insertion factor (SCO1/SenC/PrrC family)
MQTLRDRLLLISALVLLSVGAAPIPDVSLTDESGRVVRFRSDLAKGRTVAVNFIFTSCTTICSPMGATFAKVETLLGKRDVRLVSVTLDPETDTPARLAAWKKKFKGRAAWTLLTGEKEDIDNLGKALGVFTPDRVSHTPMVVVFNDANGRMSRVNGLSNAQAIIDAIDSVAPAAEDRGRAMYHEGPRADATVGDTMMSVPMACGGCHGSDGRGRTEGGVTAPEITWESLSRRGYDAKQLVRAITMGIDSSGKELAAPMPRYHLTRSDAGDLVAFLRHLGTRGEPGLTDEAIRIGVLVPEPARDVIASWAADVNRRGGIYARRVDVRFDTEDVFVAIGAGDLRDVPLVSIDDPMRAARLVEETLRRAGGGVTRESFVTTMNAILRREVSR